MADQLNMSGLNLGPQDSQSQGGPRSYIPPHMRVRIASQGPGPAGPVGPEPVGPGAPPMNGGGPPPPQAGMNGLNNSAWAG